MGRIDIVKISILPKNIDRFNAIPIKIPMAFFTQVGKKKILKCIWELKKAPCSQSNLSKEEQSRKHYIS